MGLITLAAAAATLLPAAFAIPKVHVIDVGGADLVYTPNAILADVGDLVTFNFLAKNHSVFESAFGTPCTPLEGGISSGFHAGGTGSFTVQINDTKPHWFYCAQAKHCQAGMVGVINPPANTPAKTECTFAALAAKAPANIPNPVIGGGIFTPIELAPGQACVNGTNSTSTSTTSTTSISTSASGSTSTSTSTIVAGNPADSVVVALSNGQTTNDDGGDFTIQVTVPLDNKPFTNGQLPLNLSDISLVTVMGSTNINTVACAAVINGKVDSRLATAGHDADVTTNGALTLVSAVQCGILSGSGSTGSSTTAITTAVATTTAGGVVVTTATGFTTVIVTESCSSGASAATPPPPPPPQGPWNGPGHQNGQAPPPQGSWGGWNGGNQGHW